MLLVVTKTVDATADHVLRRMNERGVRCARLNTDRFADLLVAVRFPGMGDSTLELDGVKLPLKEIRGVWLRRLATPEAPSITQDDARAFAEQELDFTLRWLLDLLGSRCPTIDREIDVLAGRNKFSQLALAQSLGLHVPTTLVTNDPTLAEKFVGEHPDVAIKSVAGYGQRSTGGFYAAYTQKVTPAILEQFAAIRTAPVCLQEYIQKAFELRITLVGDRMFTCRIDSQKTERTCMDWRRYDAQTPYSAHQVGETFREAILKMMRHYGLRFASVDAIVTPDGREVFLELNPACQFLWVERLTGLPITDAIIDELLNLQGEPIALAQG